MALRQGESEIEGTGEILCEPYVSYIVMKRRNTSIFVCD